MDLREQPAGQFTVINPATGEAIRRQWPMHRSEDGLAALDAAVAAQDAWAATPARDRADILFRTYEGILARRDEFAATDHRGNGQALVRSPD